MVQVQRSAAAASASASSPPPFILTSQFIFFFAMTGMLTFGTAGLVVPRWYHGLVASEGLPFPEDDPSYYYHFCLREFMMGAMFGTVAFSYPSLPKTFAKNFHLCHTVFVGLHFMMNFTHLQYNFPFFIFINIFQGPLFLFSLYIYLFGG